MADSTVVMWFRRDLRTADHPALTAAAAAGRVVPLFVVDPVFDRAGAPRRAFLGRALESLRGATEGTLHLALGDPTEVVPRVAREVGATQVFVTRDHGSYGRQRDAAVADALRTIDARLVGVGSNYAVPPGTVEKKTGGPFAVFTPFSRAWREVGWDAPIGVPEVHWRQVDGGTRFEAPTVSADLDTADERVAHARWAAFWPTVEQYADLRNLPAVDGTSRLSAAIRWGVIHPRQLLGDLGDEGGHRVFASELAWREFYADVLHRRPETAWQNLDRKMDALPVDTDAAARDRFTRWAEGTTGYPIVDAGMRQLAATGWMHNRVRMIVASFLVKDLHVPWQWGARHFMAHLIDGDLASNSHGWQWTAGTGTDAAPHFRVFNPRAQAERFDPDGDYVRRWVPELADIAGGAVHDPGLRRPDTYPPPMVDHAVERAEALRRYQLVSSASR
ncbi:MAG: cryptochrome/photolyase family protein [Ilumatobacteraceae bacterium]